MSNRAKAGRGSLSELERHLKQAGRERVGLSALERESVTRARRIARLSLQAHPTGRGDGDLGDALVLDGPDGPLRLAYKKRHTRRIVKADARAPKCAVRRMGACEASTATAFPAVPRPVRLLVVRDGPPPDRGPIDAQQPGHCSHSASVAASATLASSVGMVRVLIGCFVSQSGRYRCAGGSSCRAGPRPR